MHVKWEELSYANVVVGCCGGLILPGANMCTELQRFQKRRPKYSPNKFVINFKTFAPARERFASSKVALSCALEILTDTSA